MPREMISLQETNQAIKRVIGHPEKMIKVGWFDELCLLQHIPVSLKMVYPSQRSKICRSKGILVVYIDMVVSVKLYNQLTGNS